MGLGPSTKMTTKHHFYCPASQVLSSDSEVEFVGVLVDGVSECYADKVSTAEVTAQLAEYIGVDGAIVSIDGWGNHHVDFVNVIRQLRIRQIPVVGLSYIGTQGKLVCDDPLVDCIVDFNKCELGFESCIVGENNLAKEDAYKALGLLKYRMKKNLKEPFEHLNKDERLLCESIVSRDCYLQKRDQSLCHKVYKIENVQIADQTSIKERSLFLEGDICRQIHLNSDLIQEVQLAVYPPGKRDIFVNSNLDFIPIAVKEKGTLGEGTTLVLEGVTCMLTGKESGGFQPANIGSSEGMLGRQVIFDKEGTPKSTDYLIHVNVIFQEGDGRSKEGIMEAHKIADDLLEMIRKQMKEVASVEDKKNWEVRKYKEIGKSVAKRVALVKIVSGLGNMYDTVIMPKEPAGIKEGICLREENNMPHILTPNMVYDGAIHSLL